MDGINLEKHHALMSSSGVSDICSPLLSLIGITYFNYIKIYNNDCSRELLTNNPDWIKHFYKHALYNSLGAIDIEHLLPKGYFLWSELDVKDSIYIQGRDFFNIDHGISFVVKRSDVTYLYIFASDKENHQINNFYVENIDLLQRFIQYFTDHGQSLIKEACKHKIFLPAHQEIDATRVNNTTITDEIRLEFLMRAKVNRYFLLNESDHLFLTRKQAECSRLLSHGYTSKQIAKNMDISYRTVEGYVLDIKSKLQESSGINLTRSQVMQILRHSNIH